MYVYIYIHIFKRQRHFPNKIQGFRLFRPEYAATYSLDLFIASHPLSLTFEFVALEVEHSDVPQLEDLHRD